MESGFSGRCEFWGPGHQSGSNSNSQLSLSTRRWVCSQASLGMKTNIRLLAIITLTLMNFGLLATSEAVVPPPDGGYPGFNTAEGQTALSALTTGIGNTAIGWRSLFSNTDGASTQRSEPGRLFSTWETKRAARERKTPLLVQLRFKATRPAQTIRRPVPPH